MEKTLFKCKDMTKNERSIRSNLKGDQLPLKMGVGIKRTIGELNV